MQRGDRLKSWTSDAQSCGVNSEWITQIDEMLSPTAEYPDELQTIVESMRKGRNLTVEQGLILWNYPDLNMVGHLANISKLARFGQQVFFNSNLHVNQTNICTLACKFCAFRRGKRAKDAYALTVPEYLSRIQPYEGRIDEVHTVGGLHPDWDVEYYEALFSASKETYPHIHIKSLSAVEVKHIAEMSGLPTRELLKRLQSAGLDSLPGGGAEILDDDVRNVICFGKESSDEYLSLIHI